jgi:hypothetical protein
MICRRNNPLFILTVVCVFLVGFWATVASAREHRPIWLFNEQGDRITPNQNMVDPYSPRKTCGTCHDYTTITRGYHFQQGFDEIRPNVDPRRSWILSPGMYGSYFPFAAPARLAAKNNAHIRDIDLTTYDWIGGYGKKDGQGRNVSLACGACHPGGGPMEYGRNAQGRPDPTGNLIVGEKASRAALDGDYTSLLAPDGRSRFRESGVVEADCLICHGPAYRFDARVEQLNRRNYRWAATAGAGLGKVNGAIFTYRDPAAGPESPRYLEGTWNFSKRPLVQYAWTDRRVFTPEGRLQGCMISRAITSRNCLCCHGPAEAAATGQLHNPSFDAHIAKGFRCTDCHPLTGNTTGARMQHQIAKGRSQHVHVRDDLDGIGLKTCRACHLEGQYRPVRAAMSATAVNPEKKHARRFPRGASHFYLISCTACHNTVRPARGLALLDLSAGVARGFTADDFTPASGPDFYQLEAKTPWATWTTRMKREKTGEDYYTAYLPKGLQWFGEEQKNGGIRPIPLRYVKTAAGSLKNLTTRAVQGTDGREYRFASVLSDEDIRGMIQALTRLGFRRVVYLSDQLYRLQGNDITAGPLPSPDKPFLIAHGVTPLAGKGTYGAKGCVQCHDEEAPFFTKQTIRNVRGFLKDDYPALKEPNSVPQMTLWGLDDVPSY